MNQMIGADNAMKHYYSLFSGGFDSSLAILIILASEEPVKIEPVFFNYGQKSTETESSKVKELIPVFRQFAKHPETVLAECRVYKIDSLFSWSKSAILKGRGEENDTGLENRNLILLSCLSSVIQSDRKQRGLEKDPVEIITGFTNTYYDTSRKFIDAINSFFRSTKQQMKVVAPLIQNNRKEPVDVEQLITIAKSFNVLPLLDKMTWSCYFPSGDNTCGHCKPCKKRKRISKALKNNK